MATAFKNLTEEPAHYADCCPAVSKHLIRTLADRLPLSPVLILSVGSGTGLLERMLLQAGEACGRPLNVHGVEVTSCSNVHLPRDRVLEVPSTMSVSEKVMLASTFMFVYPRQTSLIGKYLDASIGGALEQVVWFGPRNDYPDAGELLLASFLDIERLDGVGIAEYEFLVIASRRKHS